MKKTLKEANLLTKRGFMRNMRDLEKHVLGKKNALEQLSHLFLASKEQKSKNHQKKFLSTTDYDNIKVVLVTY